MLVGSLRRESVTRRVAHALMRLAPPSLVLRELDLEPLPMYNPDREADAPPSWLQLRADVKAADAVLFVTPEYNRSIPAVLKNAIDIASRPVGRNAWNGKPGAIVSVTPGALGAFGANHHLRQSLVFINVLAMAQPEMYLGNATKLIDERGDVVAGSREFFTGFMAAFANWIERIG